MPPEGTQPPENSTPPGGTTEQPSAGQPPAGGPPRITINKEVIPGKVILVPVPDGAKPGDKIRVEVRVKPVEEGLTAAGGTAVETVPVFLKATVPEWANPGEKVMAKVPQDVTRVASAQIAPSEGQSAGSGRSAGSASSEQSAGSGTSGMLPDTGGITLLLPAAALLAVSSILGLAAIKRSV